jgi:phage-related protein
MARDDQRTEDEPPRPKPVEWMGSSLRDVRRFPRVVRVTFGQALFDAQTGHKHPAAKPLKGFGGAGVLEVVEDDDGNTYRAVYTVKFAGIVYVSMPFKRSRRRGSGRRPRTSRKFGGD